MKEFSQDGDCVFWADGSAIVNSAVAEPADDVEFGVEGGAD